MTSYGQVVGTNAPTVATAIAAITATCHAVYFDEYL